MEHKRILAFLLWWRHQMKNIFRVTGPLCGEYTGHRWIPRTKASHAEFWCFFLSAPWVNGWVNTREAGDLRRHRAHYDVIVMMNLTPLRIQSIWILMEDKELYKQNWPGPNQRKTEQKMWFYKFCQVIDSVFTIALINIQLVTTRWQSYHPRHIVKSNWRLSKPFTVNWSQPCWCSVLK